MVSTSEQDPQSARYTTAAPAAGWEKADFDDSAWSEGKGGFGTRDTPETHVGTEWNTPEIWIRRSVEIPAPLKGEAVLRLFHDEDAVVYLNGEKIAETKGHAAGHIKLPIFKPELIKVGRNVIAIHCRQTSGGQYIDAGIFDETAAD